MSFFSLLFVLFRNKFMNGMMDKDLKTATIKVFVICFCYVILGLGASLAWSISSAFLEEHQRELFNYFECERCGVNSGQICDRNRFERLTNPPLITIGYSLFVLYPVITLVYVIRFKREPNANHPVADEASKSTSF